MPKSNRSFWKSKLEGNSERDRRNIAALNKAGWQCLVIWECETGKGHRLENLVKRLSSS